MLIGSIHIYQMTVAPYLPDCCRFTPTCSHYGEEAIRVHGFWRGSWLTLWRILRCQPFCRGGYDPVPPKKQVPRDEPPVGDAEETEVEKK